MKRLILALILAAGLCATSFAQSGSPTTTWPYVYSDFTDGLLHQTLGNDKPGKYNICLIDNSLHYIDGEWVKSLKMSDAFAVKIGKDYWRNVGGKMYKILSSSDKALVVDLVEIDMAALNDTGGAYGSSSNTLGTMSLSSVDGIGGGSVGAHSTNHIALKNRQEEGKILKLIHKNAIIVSGKCIVANKGQVLSNVSDRDDVAAFIKSNKIKWKDVASVQILADYISDKIN